MFSYGLNNTGSEFNSSMLSEQVPSFKLQSLDKTEILDNAIFVSDEFKLLNIWASWCTICKMEHSYLLKLAHSGVNIIGLNYRDNRHDAQKMIELEGSPYTDIIFDPNGQLALDLGVLGTPETFVINHSGQIVARVSGAIDATIWKKQLGHFFNEE